MGEIRSKKSSVKEGSPEHGPVRLDGAGVAGGGGGAQAERAARVAYREGPAHTITADTLGRECNTDASKRLCAGGSRPRVRHVRLRGDAQRRLAGGEGIAEHARPVVRNVGVVRSLGARRLCVPRRFWRPGCFSFLPKFRPFYAIFRPSSPSGRQKAGKRERTAGKRPLFGEQRAENGRENVRSVALGYLWGWCRQSSCTCSRKEGSFSIPNLTGPQEECWAGSVLHALGLARQCLGRRRVELAPVHHLQVRGDAEVARRPGGVALPSPPKQDQRFTHF